MSPRIFGRGLRVVRLFDPWGSPYCTCPLKFTLNPYTGCGHGCLYCYARSYIRDFSRPRPKSRLLKDLLHDLRLLPKDALIELSASSDPYTPPEASMGLTRKVLKYIASKDFRILIVTKSNLVVRDADILLGARTSVAITITTPDESLARKLEPGAPPPAARVEAVEKLSRLGIPVTVRLDPIIPYVNDSKESIEEVVARVAEAGALQITTSTYKARPDSLRMLSEAFPDEGTKLRELYIGKGIKTHGYYYLPSELRLRYILIVREAAFKYGLAFASCREGFKFLNTPGIHCDGSLYTYLRGRERT